MHPPPHPVPHTPSPSPILLRPRHKRLRNLRLPAQAILSENLRRDRELGGGGALEQARAHNDLGPQHRLVVVDVRGAVGAVVAVDGLACLGEEGALVGGSE